MRILYPANIRFPMERANSIQIANTCHALARQGVQVELVVRRMDGASEGEALAFYGLEPVPGLRLVRLPVLNTHNQPRTWNASFYLSLALWVSWAARRDRFDLVYSREPVAVRFFARTRPWHRTRVVYELHELPASVMSRYDRLLSGEALPAEPLPKDAQAARQVCQAADGIVTLTHHLEAALKRILGVQCPITVIPDGAAVAEAMPEASSEEPTICYTGHLYRWKGLDTLIKAMDHLESRARLLIVGGRPKLEEIDLVEMADLHRSIAQSRRAQDIVLTGFVEPSQVGRYLAQCQIAVLTLADDLVPRYCNSPLKLFEYMAAGKPIVAPRLPAIEEILTDGQNALLVEPGDPQALAQAIDGLLTNPELARRLGERAFQDAPRYSWQERARAILAFAAGSWGGQN